MALAIVAHFLSEAPVLIVAPSILLGQWASELLMWLPDTKRSDVQVIKAGKDAIDPSAKFVIVSYGLVTGQKGSNAHLRATASGGAYKVIVCDECHALKQMNSQRTQAILPMLERAKRVVLMSGTPLSNCSAQDLYPIVSAIAGRGCMPSLLAWNSRYCEANKKIFTGHTYVDRWVGISEENGTELHELLSHIMVRKRKEEVLHELPPKRRSKITLEVRLNELKKVAAQMKKIEDLQAAANGASGSSSSSSIGRQPDDEGGPMCPAPELMKVFKLLADAKVGAVGEWIETSLFDTEVFDARRKAIVFAHHKSVHAKLAELFQSKLKDDRAWIHIMGETSQSQREEQLERFKTDSRCRFALLALTACGQGLNLAVADTAVFAELCWSPATLEQAEARVHRMGQASNHVNIYFLTAGEGKDSPARPCLARSPKSRPVRRW